MAIKPTIKDKTMTNSTKVQLLSNDQMQSLQDNVVNSISKNDQLIQRYLLNEVIQIEQHRNPTRLNNFFTRVGKTGSRVDAMHKFIQVVANVKFMDQPVSKNDITVFYKIKGKRSPKTFEKLFSEANEKMWSEYKTPPKIRDFSFEQQVRAIIKKAHAVNNGDIEVGEKVIDTKLLAGIEALLPADAE